jgi:hypothetical protein
MNRYDWTLFFFFLYLSEMVEYWERSRSKRFDFLCVLETYVQKNTIIDI